MCDDGNELCYIDYFCWDKSVLKCYDLDVSKNKKGYEIINFVAFKYHNST